MKLLTALLLLAVGSSVLFAQELPRPSLAKEEEGTKTLPTDYNMKAGPLLFNVTAGETTEFVDNLALTSSGGISDITVNPELGLSVRWPVTESNTLELSTSVGYTKYLEHPQFDSSDINVAPDSKLAFDLYVGDFKFNFHDLFSFQQDPVAEAALTNIVNFDRFTNDAGVTALWDLNKVILTLSYDHINFYAYQLQAGNGVNIPDPGSLNYAADQVSLGSEMHFSSTMIGGLEGAVSAREYDQESGNYYQLSVGPYLKVQVTDHLKAEMSAGLQYISSPDNSLPALPAGIGPGGVISNGTIYPQQGQGADTSYYADLSLDHELNKYYIERLSVGHTLDLGLLGEQSDVSYVNYTGSWRVSNRLVLSLNASFQDVTQVGGLVHVDPYDSASFAIQTSFPVTRSISGSVIYQFEDRLSNSDQGGYTQNRLGISFAYHF